jgi:hypothetical protein
MTLLKYLQTFFALLFFSYSANAKSVFLSGAAKIGYGTLSTPDDSTVPKTTYAIYSLDTLIGMKTNYGIIGVSGEFALWRQLTDPKNVSNVNAQGILKAVSPMLAFEWSLFRLILKVPIALIGDYTFEKKSSMDQKVAYKNPKTLSVQLHLNDTATSFWGIEYEKATFQKGSLNSVDLAIAEKKRMNMSSFSILYGYFF